MATGKQTSTEPLVSVHREFSKAVVATEVLLVVMVVGWSGCLQGFLEAGIQKWGAASHLLPIPSPPPPSPPLMTLTEPLGLRQVCDHTLLRRSLTLTGKHVNCRVTCMGPVAAPRKQSLYSTAQQGQAPFLPLLGT